MRYDAGILEDVLRLRLDGAQLHDLVAYGAELVDGRPRWELTPRDLRRYARRADALVVRRAEKDHARAVALHVARRESLYARAVTSGDYGAALAVLKDLGNVQLIYPAARAAQLLALVREQQSRIAELEAAADVGPTIRSLETGETAAHEVTAEVDAEV